MAGHQGLLVLGGPMGVNDKAEYPYLSQVERLIGEAVAAGKPVLGLCLGAQLMASALGGKVFPNRTKEIGCYRVDLTAEGRADPLFAGMGPRVPVFQWHGDTFTLPEGAVLLATAPTCAHQAFRYGRNAYGLQFHLEVTPDIVAEWADAYAAELAVFDGRSPGDLMAEVAAWQPDFAAHAGRFGRNLAAVFG